MKKDMTVGGKEWKLILLFTLPIMAGNLLQQLYNVVDGIIVGNYVGESVFASVATCNTAAMLYLALAMGLSIGVGVVVSQLFGAGNKDKLPIAIDTALILLGACGILLSIIGVVFSEALLKYLLNVPEEILPDAVAYLRIYSLGLFFQFQYNGVAAILRGFGNSKATLYFLLIATSLNIALDLIFVIAFGWEAVGVAVATVISQAVCAAASFIYLRKKFPYKRKGSAWSRAIASTIARLGLPVALQMGIVSFGNGSMQRLVNSFQSTVPGIVASYGAAIRLELLILVPIFSFQTGISNFAGQNMGAGKIERVKRGLIATLVMSMSITVVICAFVNIFGEEIVRLFGLADDALRLGVEQVGYTTLFYWIFSAFICFVGLLHGVGDTVIVSVATLSGLAVRVATGYLAAYLGWFGYSAAWATAPIQYSFAFVVAFARYCSGRWKNKAVAGKLNQARG